MADIAIRIFAVILDLFIQEAQIPAKVPPRTPPPVTAPAELPAEFVWYGPQ